jgi:hypothetical protein
MRTFIASYFLFVLSLPAFGQVPAPIILKPDQEISYSGNLGDSVKCGRKTYDTHNFNITVVQESCDCEGGFTSKIYADGLIAGVCKEQVEIERVKDPAGFIDLAFLDNLKDKEILTLGRLQIGTCQLENNSVVLKKGYERVDALKNIFRSYKVQIAEELKKEEDSEEVVAKAFRQIVKDKLCGTFNEEEIEKKKKELDLMLGQNDLAFEYFVALGKTGEDLAKMRYPVKRLKAQFNFTTEDFKGFGYNAYELRIGGFSAKSLKDARFGISDLVNAGFNAKTELKPLFLISEFKRAGYNAYNLRLLDYTALEIRDAGFGISDLVNAGFDAKTNLKPIFTIQQFKSAGYNAYNLRLLDYTSEQIKNVGYGISDLVNAGFSAKDDLKKIFTIQEFKTAGYNAYNLRLLAYTAPEIKKVGYGISDLVNAGFDTKREIKPIFTIQEFKTAGYNAYNLRLLDYSALEIKNAGFKISDLVNAGFDARWDLKPIFSIAEFKNGGYSAYNMKNLGYMARELLNAGYSISELKNAGYTDSEILN